MSYSKIKKIEDALPSRCHVYYGSERLDEELFSNLSTERFTSDPDVATQISIRKTGLILASVRLGEVFECCAKGYLFGFTGKEYLIPLISVGVELAKNGGYSYIGFTHKKDHEAIKAGKELGFQCILSYKNTRSENRLNEMALVI